jgi:hypothetical protein
MTDSLAWHTYRYAQLLEGDPAKLDPSVEVQARALSYPFTVLGFAYAERGQMDTALASLARAVQLSDDPAIRGAYQQLRARQLQGKIAPGDSTSR